MINPLVIAGLSLRCSDGNLGRRVTVLESADSRAGRQ